MIIVNIDTPQEERRKLHIGDIWINEAKCLKCETVIRSMNRHDFVRCKCGAIAVDGGSWYARRVFKHLEDIEDNIVMFNDIREKEET